MKLPTVKFEHVSAGIALLAVSFMCVYLPFVVRSGQKQLTTATAASLAKSTKSISSAMDKMGETADAATTMLNQATATMKTMQDLAKSSGGETKSLKQLTDSLTATVSQAKTDLSTVNDLLSKAKPLEDNLNGEVIDLRGTTTMATSTLSSINRRVSSPQLSMIENNLVGFSGHANHISSALDYEVTKIIYPVPCRKSKRPKWDIFTRQRGCQLVHLTSFVPEYANLMRGVSATQQVFNGVPIYGTVKVKK